MRKELKMEGYNLILEVTQQEGHRKNFHAVVSYQHGESWHYPYRAMIHTKTLADAVKTVMEVLPPLMKKRGRRKMEWQARKHGC